MKKIVVLISVLLCVVLTLSSCEVLDKFLALMEPEPESAEELYEKIDKKMKSFTEYETNSELTMEFYINNIGSILPTYPKIRTEATEYTIQKGIGTDDFFFYQEMETSVTSSGTLDIDENIKSKTEYNSGYIYISNEGDYKQKLCSEMTVEEFGEYLLSKSTMPSIEDFLNCTKKEFSKNEDDTWSLKLSGYSNYFLNQVVDMLRLNEAIVEIDIEDIELSINAAKDYSVNNIEMKFIFKQNGFQTNSLKYVTEYSSYDNVAVEVDTAIHDEYNEIEDITILDDIDDMLEAIIDDNYGKFNLSIKQEMSTGGTSQIVTEVDDVIYGERSNGNYFYKIDAVTGGVALEMTYENSILTVKRNGQLYGQGNQEENVARATVNALINNVRYNKALVTDLEVNDNGEIIVTIDTPDEAHYLPAFESSGMDPAGADQIIKFTVNDGKITKITSEVTSKAVFGGQTLSFTLTIENTYKN